MPTERYLPKWAQEEMRAKDLEISSLRRRVADAESAITGNSPGFFSYNPMGSMDNIHLPESVRHVRIKLPNGFEVDVQPQSDNNGGVGTKDTIQIMVVSHHGFAVWPQAANVVQIGPRRML